MGTKRVQLLVIKLNNGNTIAIEQSRLRQFLAKMSNKFHELLKKFKLI